ncbi:MAG TPA: M20/M25/M40 family metallo-hydrolase [Gemmatimonadaceae bacterium]|nr:M20/M25/M40 family metallo-hydrolase [Gemmatimonadaceae bacterium]
MTGGPARLLARLLVAALVGLVGVQAQGQAAGRAPALSATERRIASAVDQRNAQALALLERVVNINSGTMNFEGVRKVGDAFRAELDALGFSTRWVDGAGFRRAGHLVAERNGRGPRILLIGHLDTVFEPRSPFQKFERLTDSTARGPGVIDMKGGDVIIVEALRALKAAGVLDGLSITVVMHGDEEDAGTPLDSARATLIDAAKRSQIALGFEDGSGDPHTAVISRRSAGSWTLRTTGTPGHSSQIFRDDIGAGALYEAARILDGFRTRLGGQQYLTINPGVVLGGSEVKYDTAQSGGTAFGKTNVIAGQAIVSGDIRALSPEQLEQAMATMKEIVSQHLPKTTAELTFDDGYPPMAPTDGNRRLLAVHDSVSRALGFGSVVAVDPSKAGAADVSFAAPYVPMGIDALGLAGWDDHSDKETANLNWLPRLTKRAAVLIYRLGSRESNVPRT